jgi:hypothetical protein
MFKLAPPDALLVTKTPATLAVKGGTVGREMAGKFGLKIAS